MTVVRLLVGRPLLYIYSFSRLILHSSPSRLCRRKWTFSQPTWCGRECGDNFPDAHCSQIRIAWHSRRRHRGVGGETMGNSRRQSFILISPRRGRWRRRTRRRWSKWRSRYEWPGFNPKSRCNCTSAAPPPVIRIEIANASCRVEGQENEGESTGPIATHFASSSVANQSRNPVLDQEPVGEMGATGELS